MSLLNINGTAPETVREVTTSILQILGADVDEPTKRLALRVLRTAAKAQPVTLTNCNFTGDLTP